MNSAYDVIIAPVVTEKCNALIQDKKYTFRVHPAAGRTMKMGRRADWKRAVVTLAEGSIEII